MSVCLISKEFEMQGRKEFEKKLEKKGGKEFRNNLFS